MWTLILTALRRDNASSPGRKSSQVGVLRLRGVAGALVVLVALGLDLALLNLAATGTLVVLTAGVLARLLTLGVDLGRVTTLRSALFGGLLGPGSGVRGLLGTRSL